MNALARWLVRHPLLVLALHVAVTAVLGAYAVQIRIESSLESMLPIGDPEVQYYNTIRATFGSDDVAVIGMRADDLFAAASLQALARVTDAVATIDGVERVLSLTNAVDPAADVFDPPRLLPHIPPSPRELAALKQRLRETPLFSHNLVAPDFSGAAINVFFRNLTDTEYARLRIDERIEEILAAGSGAVRFYFTGAAHLKKAGVDLMRHDLYRLTPLAVGLVVATLWWSFGGLRGVVLPLVSVLMAVTWTLGVMVLCGKPITLGTFVLPPLILILGSEYAIHVMAHYSRPREGTGEARHVQDLREVGAPVLITALTTILGFSSLMFNRITAIWDLGLFSAMGLTFLIFTTLGFLPAALRTLTPRLVERTRDRGGARIRQLLTWLGMHAVARRGAVIWGGVALALVAVVGARRIEVDSDFLSYFDESSPVRQANEEINQRVVGSNPFYLVIEGSEPGLLKRWEVLKEIRELQQFVERQAGVTSTISLVDYLELLEKGLARGGSGDIVVDEQGRIVESPPATFWDDPKSLAPVLELVVQSPDTFKGVVTKDFARGTVLVRTRLSRSREIETLLDRIRDYIARSFPAEIRIRPTGTLVLLTGTTSDLVAGQVSSLSFALGVIFVVLSAMFLSVRVGVLAILPNVLPIMIFFGVMGWGRIYLNMGTSLIAAISLGLAVDFTIYYMTQLNFELKGETDQRAALMRVMRSVGVSIVYSTLALFCGFCTFALSGFVPLQNFGVLTGATLVTSIGTNLVLLPALLATTKIITLWDLVAVRLGQDPTGTIPLFAGLRPAQARIVVLMGEIRRFAPGDAIVRRGEQGTEMYVILQGATEVWAGSGEERKRVAALKRGDVFGEMALVRHDERTADVIAAGPVEALAVDERFLQRIQRRYPRIAARVFLNLTRILSDRLERTTQQFVAAH
jgi:hypothetical protein